MESAVVLALPLILTGGLFSNANNMGLWIVWISYISPIRYGFDMLTRSQLYDMPVELHYITTFLDQKIGYWKCVGLTIGLMIVIHLML